MVAPSGGGLGRIFDSDHPSVLGWEYAHAGAKGTDWADHQCCDSCRLACIELALSRVLGEQSSFAWRVPNHSLEAAGMANHVQEDKEK
jgi:hypothetical protein